MKAIKGICWAVLLGLMALPALAATVNMQFTGLPTGNNYSGVASYPYEISPVIFASANSGPNTFKAAKPGRRTSSVWAASIP